jgi:hypothetical protein
LTISARSGHFSFRKVSKSLRQLKTAVTKIPIYSNFAEIVKEPNYYKNLPEKARRHFLGLECNSLGKGSQVYISKIFGCARDTIIKGVKELSANEKEIDYNRQRKAGGGRKKKKS